MEMYAHTYRNFYEEKLSSNCLLRLHRTFEKHKSRPLPPVFKARIDGPSSAWKVFKRLLLATEYADTHTTDCMIFSYEGIGDDNGQRLFLVAHPMHMWSNYKFRPSKEKCSYEVIRENYPCKLYFDLEYYTAFNSNKDGILMTKVFIKCVIAAMLDQFNIYMKESDFLWLDASNPLKYSCHLILQMKNIAFQNNIHAGIFVSKLLSCLRLKIDNNCPSEGLWPSGDEIKCLLVVTKNNNHILFCDEAVYSKNRNFRLYLSSKLGKGYPLLLSKHNQYIPSIMEKDKDEAIFYDSLITYFRDKNITRLLSYEDKDSLTNACSHPSSFSGNLSSKKQNVSSCLPSPFSNLDDFILGMVKDNTSVGFLRKWTLVTSEQKIIYDIGSYRFCYNIGRHHKSNNIRIIVDMKSRFYYQTCLDPECCQQHFQSEAFAIPEDISFVNVPDDFFEDACFTQLPVVEIGKCNNSENIDRNKINGYSMDSVDVTESMFDDSEDFSNFDIACANEQQESNQSNKMDNIFCSREPNYWHNIFSTDFSCSLSDNVSDEKVMQEPAVIDSCVLDDEFWNIESASCESLGNVSHEDELLMVNAAEVTEAALSGNLFSEETIF